MVLHAHRDGGQVHDTQSFGENFLVCYLAEFLCVGVFLRVSGVDTVHARTFEHDVCFQLDGAQCRRRVRGKIGVGGAAGYNHHIAFLKQPQGFGFVVVIADRLHAHGGQHTHFLPDGFQRRLQGERVDNRREHTHLVAFHAVETFLAPAQTAEDVAAAYHDTYLHAEVGYLFDLAGVGGEALLVNAITFGAHKALTREFQ